jgi:hypothetical protein
VEENNRWESEVVCYGERTRKGEWEDHCKLFKAETQSRRHHDDSIASSSTHIETGRSER